MLVGADLLPTCRTKPITTTYSQISFLCGWEASTNTGKSALPSPPQVAQSQKLIKFTLLTIHKKKVSLGHF